MTDATDFPCERIGCEAKPGEPCKEIPSGDGLVPYDRELEVATVHQARLRAERDYHNTGYFRCPTCFGEGRGSFWITTGTDVCPRCKGDGRITL